MEINPVQAVEGAPSPVAAQPQEQIVETRQIVRAVKAVSQSGVLGDHRELAFLLDRETRRPVIQIIDSRTKEVIQQVPPEYVLRVAEGLRQTAR